MLREVDVAIIGAGTAGLSALGEIRKRTNNFVLINDGPYGTTCARVGCMPSKVLIEAADVYHKRLLFNEMGFRVNGTVLVDGKTVLERVRRLRDKYVADTLRATYNMGDKNISGRAKVLSPNLLEVNGERIKTKAMIIATGSVSVVPEAWKKFGDRILTNSTLFEMDDLPKSLAVVGLGAIGLEMAQAFSRLGVAVTGFDALNTVGGISDPDVAASAIQIFGEDFPLHLGTTVAISEHTSGKLTVKSGDTETVVEKVLIAVGRKPNIAGLSLENLGVPLNKEGIPDFDEHTMQVGNLPVFIAGDVNGRAQFLAEAADDGHIAGVNSLSSRIKRYCRRTPLAIVFTHPNIAFVGSRYKDLEKTGISTGKMNFAKQTRAIASMKNRGLLRVYAENGTGRLLGAEMAIPEGEHIAHLLSWGIQRNLTVFDMLELNYYHPVVEEGVRKALRLAARRVEKREPGPEVPLCPDAATEKR